jgi:hypothetical protein
MLARSVVFPKPESPMSKRPRFADEKKSAICAASDGGSYTSGS